MTVDNADLELIQQLMSDNFYKSFNQACEKLYHIVSIICLELSSEEEFIYSITRRIKTPFSIFQTVKNETELNKIDDIAGIRVVVHNKKDAKKVFDQIKINKVDNSIDKPKKDGYRGIHVKMEIRVGNEYIACELQIRSMSQDIWATLSHRDVYKEFELSKKLIDEMNRFSRMLNEVDEEAISVIELIKSEKESGNLPPVKKHVIDTSLSDIPLSEFMPTGSAVLKKDLERYFTALSTYLKSTTNK